MIRGGAVFPGRGVAVDVERRGHLAVTENVRHGDRIVACRQQRRRRRVPEPMYVLLHPCRPSDRAISRTIILVSEFGASGFV